MFTLTKDELNSAFAAINHHGYSSMLPEPAEWGVVKANWAAVRDTIEKIDLDTYEPYSAMKVFAPKNRANIRVTHLLHPQDLIIYTALVIIASSDIEKVRIPVKSRRVFSYRATGPGEDALYTAKGSYEAYLAQLGEKSNRPSIKFVAIADIADFYPRIYQHRLENVIESVATNQRTVDVARVLVRKLISNLMGRNSYGIPVGPYASRLLGEAVLIDVDSNLQSQGIDFVRWVDDYNIFCKNEYEAQSVLFTLGEWLFSNHGLTLQSAKSKILPVARYRSEILIKPDEQVTDRDTVLNALRDFRIGYEGEDEDDPSEEEIAATLAVLQGIDLKGMLERSLADTALVDYEAVNYALVKLPRIPGASEDLKAEVLHLVIDNAQLLYPVAEQISKYVRSFNTLSAKDQREIATKLLKPLKSKRNPPPPYYAMWILDIFASSNKWNHVKDIIALYRDTRSEVVKRYASLAIEVSGSRNEALVIKEDYIAASPMLRSAILFATRKLGVDERKHWKLSKSVNGVVEKLI